MTASQLYALRAHAREQANIAADEHDQGRTQQWNLRCYALTRQLNALLGDNDVAPDTVRCNAAHDASANEVAA